MTDLHATVIGMEIGPENRDRRRKPDDDATLRELAAFYRAGKSIRQISAHTGWSYGVIQSRLVKAQASGLVVLRPRGGVGGPRQPRKPR